MLDVLGFVVACATILIDYTVIAGALRLSGRGRIWLAAGVGAWVGLAAATAAAGGLAFAPGQPVPLVAVFFALPLLAATALAVTSPAFRATLLAIPTHLLIAIHGLRLLGVLFLGLAAVGRLSGPFPYSAAWGDMITGAAALLLAYVWRRGAELDALAWAWNLFGALDLFAAVGLGLASAEGSPVQLLHVGAGSQAMQYLPYSLVPTVLVPFYLVSHGVIAAQLLARRRATALRPASDLA